MKKIVAAISMFALTAQAQQPRSTVPPKPVEVEASTALERTQLTYGKLIIKGYSQGTTINAMGGEVTVKLVEIKESSSRTRGIVVEVLERGRLERRERSFVDYDELDALIAGNAAILKASKASTALDKFEAIYKTRGGLELTMFSRDNGEISFAVGVGNLLKATAFLDSQERTLAFATALKEAKARLDALK